MRLGLRPTVFEEASEEWSRVRRLYGGAGKIWERHRHRYEVNPAYIEQLTESGMTFVGRDEKGERMQVFELKGVSPSVYWLLGADDVCRPSLLRGLPGPPRILHTPAEPVTPVPRVRLRGGEPQPPGGADRASA